MKADGTLEEELGHQTLIESGRSVVHSIAGETPEVVAARELESYMQEYDVSKACFLKNAIALTMERAWRAEEKRQRKKAEVSARRSRDLLPWLEKQR